MNVKIYKPAKTAMQSGQAKTKDWLLEFEPGMRKFVEPLMGWTGQVDTNQQLTLRFDTEEEAIAYAQKHGFAYVLVQPKTRKIKPKAYADNFKFDRVTG